MVESKHLVAGVITLLVACESPAEDRAATTAPTTAPVAPPPSPSTQPTPQPIPRPAAPQPSAPADNQRTTEKEPQTAATQEHARTAGILGSETLQEGGAFASLTGTGDVASGSAGSREGYGVGRGGMRGRSSAVPTVAIGQATVSPIAGGNGELDKAVVRRYVKRNIQKIQYCYEKELLAKPTLEGAVTTTFTITDAGTVGKTSATGVDVTVAACVGNVIQGIEFPRPKGTGGVAVSYLFTFERASSSP